MHILGQALHLCECVLHSVQCAPDAKFQARLAELVSRMRGLTASNWRERQQVQGTGCLSMYRWCVRPSLAVGWVRNRGPQQPDSSRWVQEEFPGSLNPSDPGPLSDVCSSLHQESSYSQSSLLLYDPALQAVMMPSFSSQLACFNTG